MRWSGREQRACAALVFAVGGAIAVACGGSNGNPPGFVVDAGGGAGSGGGVDGAGATGDDGSASGDDGGPIFGPDATPPLTLDAAGDDSSTGDAAFSGDAPFAFDGFAYPDGTTDASYCVDDDGDGFTECDGDCDDHDSLVSPCAFDTNAASGDPVGSDGKDNDCDGQVDNRRTCETGLTAGHDATPAHYAAAMELCDNADPRCKIVVSATFDTLASGDARRITGHMGSNFHPHAGAFMTFLSSGQADDDIDTSTYRPGQGTDYGAGGTHPDPLPASQNTNECGTGGDESKVAIHDMVELDLTLRAPINAGSFTFDFNFFSEEYPKYVCAGYNDTFLAMLKSVQYPTPFQIAFDAQNHRVNVNNGFFADCTSVAPPTESFTHACSGALSLLNGTGYEVKYYNNDNQGSGATDWLKTTAPIQPGETFTLKFYIFDEKDGILDSAVNLDNFRWNSTTVGSPVTAR